MSLRRGYLSAQCLTGQDNKKQCNSPTMPKSITNNTLEIFYKIFFLLILMNLSSIYILIKFINFLTQTHQLSIYIFYLSKGSD